MGHCGSAHSKTCCIALPLVIILTWMCRMHERVTEKPMGKFLASTSFSSIFASHAISMAVSSSHGLMLRKIINCCIQGFHECKRMKTFFQCFQLTQISSQVVSISRTNLHTGSNTWSSFDLHVKLITQEQLKYTSS